MNLDLRTAGSGLADIVADGKLVGRVRREWKQDEQKCMVPAYDADLWLCPGCAQITGRASRPTLRELREELQARLDREGPWWR